jgi:hypothetical protein
MSDDIRKPKFPKGSSSWWNLPRSEMTDEQKELRRKYDREKRAEHRKDPIKKSRDLNNYRKHVDKNKSKVYKRNSEWRKKNWKSVYLKRRECKSFQVESAVRTRIWNALTSNKMTKSKKTAELLGCDIKFFRQHLENQFTDGMTWDNYGEWHIDHILPCCSFDLTLIENQKKCFNYFNTRPLWKKDNFDKAKLDKLMSINQL